MVCAFTFCSCGYVRGKSCVDGVGVDVEVFRGVWEGRALAFSGRGVVVGWCCRCNVGSRGRLGAGGGTGVVLSMKEGVGDGNWRVSAAVLDADMGGSC